MSARDDLPREILPIPAALDEDHILAPGVHVALALQQCPGVFQGDAAPWGTPLTNLGRDHESEGSDDQPQ